MTNLEKDALVLMLRSKTALGRLVEAEVHSVLAFLEGIGFVHQVAVPAVLTPAMQVAAQIAQVPVSALSNLESIIEKDVKAFFEPAPIAPPPA